MVALGLDSRTECYDEGYSDGQTNDFTTSKFTSCEEFAQQSDKFINNPYFSGFVDGCLAANPGATREGCEEDAD